MDHGDGDDRRVVVAADDRRGRWFFQDLVDPLVTAAQTDGRYSMWELLGPPGDEVPLHVHRHEDEAFFVLEGELTVWMGDRTATLRPGDFALLPRDVPHCYKVTSSESARWLGITSPSGFERFVEAVSVPAAERRLPDPIAPDPAALERAAQLAAEVGVEFLGPPGVRP